MVIVVVIHVVSFVLHIVDKRTFSRKIKHIKFKGTCMFLQDADGLEPVNSTTQKIMHG